MISDTYTQNGYASRADYLRQLAEENEVSYRIVIHLANTLGPSEDFDLLVSEVEDYALMHDLNN